MKIGGYIALTDGEEIHALASTRALAKAKAKRVLGHGEFVVEPASKGLVDYYEYHGVTPTIVEVGGVNCLRSEAGD